MHYDIVLSGVGFGRLILSSSDPSKVVTLEVYPLGAIAPPRRVNVRSQPLDLSAAIELVVSILRSLP